MNDEFTNMLSEYINEYYYSTHSLPDNVGITNLIPKRVEIFKRITTIPELQQYAITSNGFIFKMNPLETHIDCNGNILVNKIYNYDSIHDCAKEGIIELEGMCGEIVSIDVDDLILREFFGYTIPDKIKFDQCYNSFEDITDLINYMECIHGNKNNQFFVFPFW